MHSGRRSTTRRGKVTRADLPYIYADFGYTVGVEVGVSKGGHAKLMCERVPDLKLYCVDPYMVYHMRRKEKRQQQIYEFACKLLANCNVEMVRKTSMEAVKDFEDESLDFVYIDGNHKFDYVITDLIFWAEKINKQKWMKVGKSNFLKTNVNRNILCLFIPDLNSK